MSTIIETTQTVNHDQALAREAALGPVDGLCCRPEISPCLACATPTAEEEADRLAWTRDHAARADAMAREAVCELRADWLRDRPEDDDEAWDAAVEDDEDADFDLDDAPAPTPRTFIEKITGLAHAFLDHPDPDIAIVGEWLWEKKETAEILLQGANSAEQYRDRLACHLDAELAWIEASR